MASDAGKPKPSKNDGTSATRAVEYSLDQLLDRQHALHQGDAVLDARARGAR